MIAPDVDADVEELLDYVRREGFETVDAETRARYLAAIKDPDLDAFLDADEPERDEIIPGLLERRDRAIFTGPEGGGKSTLLRQIAVQAGAGIHPFTLEPAPPISVLYVDLENSRKYVRRAFRPLRAAVGASLERGTVIPFVRDSGVDLMRQKDRDSFRRLVDRNQPDLVTLGPLYKLHDGDPTEEGPAKAVARFLDELRADFDIAVLIEAHCSYGSGGKRPERPYGASLWSRWPEFGLFLSATGQLRHWRGQREERDWPAQLKRGGEWPWTVEHNGRAVTFAQMIEAVRELGMVPSNRQIAIRVGSSEATVRRAISANQAQWDEVVSELRA